MLDVTSYYGYLRKAYSGKRPIPELEPEDSALAANSQNRRFFFDFGSGLSSLGFGDYKEEKERCQFKPYFYDNYGDGFSG